MGRSKMDRPGCVDARQPGRGHGGADHRAHGADAEPPRQRQQERAVSVGADPRQRQQGGPGRVRVPDQHQAPPDEELGVRHGAGYAGAVRDVCTVGDFLFSYQSDKQTL